MAERSRLRSVAFAVAVLAASVSSQCCAHSTKHMVAPAGSIHVPWARSVR